MPGDNCSKNDAGRWACEACAPLPGIDCFGLVEAGHEDDDGEIRQLRCPAILILLRNVDRTRGSSKFYAPTSLQRWMDALASSHHRLFRLGLSSSPWKTIHPFPPSFFAPIVDEDEYRG